MTPLMRVAGMRMTARGGHGVSSTSASSAAATSVRRACAARRKAE